MESNYKKSLKDMMIQIKNNTNRELKSSEVNDCLYYLADAVECLLDENVEIKRSIKVGF
jgi:hypothetical protein